MFCVPLVSVYPDEDYVLPAPLASSSVPPFSTKMPCPTPLFRIMKVPASKVQPTVVGVPHVVELLPCAETVPSVLMSIAPDPALTKPRVITDDEMLLESVTV